MTLSAQQRFDEARSCARHWATVGVALACTLALLHIRSRGATSATAHVWSARRALANGPASVPACKLLKYAPSPWESEWVAQADALAEGNAICPTMIAQGSLVDAWLGGVASCKADGVGCWSALPDRVFSKFVKECTHGDGRAPTTVEERIEPLAGHMRHPRTPEACLPPGAPAVSVEDRSYLLLGGVSPSDLRARYPGRAILVDAGTNEYSTSLGYLIPAYAAMGIHFDAVYAWEAAGMSAQQYWASVPDDVKPRLHFYNAPISAVPGSSMNPVDWIKAMHQPGDFIVFKLDVDNEAIETALVDQIAAMNEPGNVIAEMFYEKHYDTPDMKAYWGVGQFEAGYSTGIRLMQSMRKVGVRMHFWP